MAPGWGFIVWGGLHGILLIGQRLLANALPHGLPRMNRELNRWLKGLLMFLVVTLFWVPFRANSLAEAVRIISQIGISGTSTSLYFAPEYDSVCC
jgi:alginate O-acetyltransferase complex protein AlgI